jgi:bifunctional DNA-binding transcriptional regulator/antitoxin component of YhaV-PrlF toxin-antitoxin module
MSLVKTTRLTKHDKRYEIEIPEEFIEKLGWRNGTILEIDVEHSQAVIKKLHGFVGV